MVVSEARLSSRPKGIIWGIVGASCAVVLVSAMAGNILVPGLIISVGLIALTWLILSMRVSIEISAEHVVIRCRPFYTAKIRLSDIQSATKTSETTLSDGYGVRFMGVKTRGVLVGGPAVAVETPTLKWIVSAKQPEAVALKINEQINHK